MGATDVHRECQARHRGCRQLVGQPQPSNINGNVIFLPAAGYRNDAKLNDAGVEGHYCSSTLDTKNNWSNAAFNEHFSAVAYGDNESWRSYGHSVRAVKE